VSRWVKLGVSGSPRAQSWAQRRGSVCCFLDARGARVIDRLWPIVLVPQFIPKLVRWVESPFQFEEFTGSRIRTKELLRGGVELIRKVVRSA
jgi:hypothetical protein